jgi:hypothetical protein
MFINEISKVVVAQIDNDEWIPDWGDNLDRARVLIKKDTEFKLWIGGAAAYCEMYKPMEYNPFGYFGRRAVYKAAIRCVKRNRANTLAKDILNSKLKR